MVVTAMSTIARRMLVSTLIKANDPQTNSPKRKPGNSQEYGPTEYETIEAIEETSPAKGSASSPPHPPPVLAGRSSLAPLGI